MLSILITYNSTVIPLIPLSEYALHYIILITTIAQVLRYHNMIRCVKNNLMRSIGIYKYLGAQK
jgi:hypothetical protein